MPAPSVSARSSRRGRTPAPADAGRERRHATTRCRCRRSGPPQDAAEPGSRANWPLLNSGDDARRTAARRAAAASAPPADGRVRPPWQDMPTEPPALRLVEPQLSGLENLAADVAAITEPPPLRLVDRDLPGRNGRDQPDAAR